MKIEKIQKLKNNKYKIKIDSGDIINTYDDVILNNSLLFNKATISSNRFIAS